MLPRPEARRAALAMLLGAGLLAAQAEPPPLRFSTPDGSRVVLLPAAGPPVVHWAIATPCGPQYDPVAAPGLAAACVQVSLGGTWLTGSRDADAEVALLAALDEAEADLAAVPRTESGPPAALTTKVEELRGAARAISDPLAFRRVLLAAPTTGIEIDVRDGRAVLAFTTTPAAVPAVAALLRERREQQALRGIRATWEQLRDRETAAWDADPLAPLRAEALALAYPGNSFAHAGDRPPGGGFSRALALQTWVRTQHPSRTVHVLTGNFDAEAVAAALRGAFATTALPPPPAVPPAVPRAATARRGAVVPGARQPAVVIAFGLQGNEDPHLLALMASWFGVGPDSWLGRELRRAGRRDVMVHAAAPWPAAAATGLFAIEVLDAAGGAPGLADQVLALCGREVPKQPQTAELRGRHGLLLAAFERDTRRGVDHAARVAVELLRHPSPELPLTPPEQAAFAELPERLQQILDTPPIVVEWRSR